MNGRRLKQIEKIAVKLADIVPESELSPTHVETQIVSHQQMIKRVQYIKKCCIKYGIEIPIEIMSRDEEEQALSVMFFLFHFDTKVVKREKSSFETELDHDLQCLSGEFAPF